MIIFLALVLNIYAAPVKAPHVEVDLISQYDSFSSDEDNFFAFSFKLDPGWHIYWKNPGDSGKEPLIKWDESASAYDISDFMWPQPHKMPLEILMNYGYEGNVAIPFKVRAKSPPKNNFELAGRLEWLICRVECIPGKADLSIRLPLSENRKPSKHYNQIHAALSKVPLKDDQIKGHFNLSNGIFTVHLSVPEKSLPPFSSLYFYPEKSLTILHAEKQEFEIDKNSVVLKIPADENVDPMLESLNGVLTFIPKSGNIEAVAFDVKIPRLKSDLTSSQSSGFALLLLFAFLGGLILNLMPCVFPVLSLKILGFVYQSKKNPKSIRKHGWLYTSGVVISFWALTLILILLKASGEAVGWGFQLQSPYFVLAMSYLFFFIGLNLLGFFDFGGSLGQLGGKVNGSGYLSSFQTGILATIVATPCTAPFMGAAIGVAFTLPLLKTFMVFTALALGLALPYLALSYFPAWLKILPKPGLWMQKMKEFFAFPIFATMLWLLWVFEQQTNLTNLFLVLFSFLLLLFLFWLHKYYKKRKVAFAILGTVMVISPFFYLDKREPQKAEANLHSAWEAYDEAKLSTYLIEGSPVFIDFTASWCLTCQVNKKLVLNTDDIQSFFKQNNVKLIVADWTNSDPAITKKLEEFNRNSVPLYVFYPGKNQEGPKTPKVLAEILSKQMIYNLIDQ